LLFRLRGFEISVPPLRHRLEDLPLLVEHFRRQLGGDGRTPAFGEDALRALAAYPWPGNVRELENTVTRLVLTRAQSIRAEDAALVLGTGESGGVFAAAVLSGKSLSQLQEELEREYVRRTIVEHGGDLPGAAQALGITLRALYARLHRLGLRPKELR
jgi:DNA-binding NtrC family response regulator